jgi:hypothetical protein
MGPFYPFDNQIILQTDLTLCNLPSPAFPDFGGLRMQMPEDG